FAAAERERGWHRQYNALDADHLVWQASTLRSFDPIGARFWLLDTTLKESGPAADLRCSLEGSPHRALQQLRTAVNNLDTSNEMLRSDLLHAERERIRQVEEIRSHEVAAQRYHADRHEADRGRIQEYSDEQIRLLNEVRAMRESRSWRLTAP